MSIPPNQPYPLQIRSGPWDGLIETFVLAEGEPYLEQDSGGSGISAVLYGNHFVQNKLLGGGFQEYTGDSLNSIVAPRGVAVLTVSNEVMVSDGGGWFQLGGSSSTGTGGGGGSSNIGTIDGGTWV